MIGTMNLVTGATGFIGRALVEALLERGEPVRALVRTPEKAQDLAAKGVELVAGVLPDAIPAEAFRGVQTVFHLAGVIASRDREVYDRVNAEGTLRLAERVAQESPEAHFIFTSSLSAHGPSPYPAREEDLPHPISAYGKSKLKAERGLRAFRGRIRKITILRPVVVYGPGEKAYLGLIRLAQKGWFPHVPGFRAMFIHVRDLVEAYLRARDQAPADWNLYFVAHPEIHSFRTFGELLEEALGRPVRFFPLFPSWLRAAWMGVVLLRPFWSLPARMERLEDIRGISWQCSVEKARKELGFLAKISFRMGLREMLGLLSAQGLLHNSNDQGGLVGPERR